MIHVNWNTFKKLTCPDLTVGEMEETVGSYFTKKDPTAQSKQNFPTLPGLSKEELFQRTTQFFGRVVPQRGKLEETLEDAIQKEIHLPSLTGCATAVT